MEFSLSPFLIQYGGFGIRYYSLMYLLALLLSYAWLTKVAKYDREKIADFCLYGFLWVVLGSRLGYALFYQPQWFWTEPLSVLKIWEGGMSFHGGLIAAALWIAYFLKKQRWDFWRFADALVVPIILGIGFGRIGNFLNGELWGRITDVPWCFHVEGWEGCRHPSQLYQFLANLITFGILCLSYFRSRKSGVTAALFLICYGIGRSVIEMLWREPSWVWMGLTAGTWLSLPMILVGGILLILRLRR